MTLPNAQTTSHMDLNYDEYQQRQLLHVETPTLFEGLKKISVSGKFTFENEVWIKHAYPGYALVTKVMDYAPNQSLHTTLQEIQEECIYHTQLRDYIFPLPPDSFHQTIANTLSGERFLQHIHSPGLDYRFPQMVLECLKDFNPTSSESFPQMQMIGLSFFGNSFGLLGVFQQESHYRQIVDFRHHFYSRDSMTSLDIHMTRPFIGHITLGYFGRSLSDNHKKKLLDAAIQINRKLSIKPVMFTLNNVRLCRYDELSVFNNPLHYPIISL